MIRGILIKHSIFTVRATLAMKWATNFAVVVLVLAPTSSRTVKPASYSYSTSLTEDSLEHRTAGGKSGETFGSSVGLSESTSRPLRWQNYSSPERVKTNWSASAKGSESTRQQPQYTESSQFNRQPPQYTASSVEDTQSRQRPQHMASGEEGSPSIGQRPLEMSGAQSTGLRSPFMAKSTQTYHSREIKRPNEHNGLSTTESGTKFAIHESVGTEKHQPDVQSVNQYRQQDSVELTTQTDPAQDYNEPVEPVSSPSIPNHPSILAHHYYDTTTADSFYTQSTANDYDETYTPQVTSKKSRKKPEYVPKVSYVNYPTTTESNMHIRKINVRTRNRLKSRDEIPVNEEYQSASDEQLPRTELQKRRRKPVSLTYQRSQTTEFTTLSTSLPYDVGGSSTPEYDQSSERYRSKYRKKRPFSQNTESSSTHPPKTRSPYRKKVQITETIEAPSHTHEVDDSIGDVSPSPASEDDYEDSQGITEVSTTIRNRLQNQRRSQNQRLSSEIQPSSRSTEEPKYKKSFGSSYIKKIRNYPSKKLENDEHFDSNNRRYENNPVQYTDETSSHTASDLQADRDPSSETTDAANASDLPEETNEMLKFSDAVKVNGLREQDEYDETSEDDPKLVEESQDQIEKSVVEEEHQEQANTYHASEPEKVLHKPMQYSYSKDQKHAASAEHEDEKDDQKEEKHKTGGGEKHKSSHHETKGDKEEKEYESHHEFDKGKKGHEDKENRKKVKHVEKGKKKKHKEEGGHYGEHHVESKGEKEAEFGETGKHKKGHSTKGSHNVHKKNEFLKKHEFYDEHHEGDDHKKYGDLHEEHDHKKGGKKKKQHKDSNYSSSHKGKKGKHNKGAHEKEHKGHKKKSGIKKHYEHEEDYADKGGHYEHKKWKYDKH